MPSKKSLSVSTTSGTKYSSQWPKQNPTSIPKNNQFSRRIKICWHLRVSSAFQWGLKTLSVKKMLNNTETRSVDATILSKVNWTLAYPLRINRTRRLKSSWRLLRPIQHLGTATESTMILSEGVLVDASAKTGWALTTSLCESTISSTAFPPSKCVATPAQRVNRIPGFECNPRFITMARTTSSHLREPMSNTSKKTAKEKLANHHSILRLRTILPTLLSTAPLRLRKASTSSIINNHNWNSKIKINHTIRIPKNDQQCITNKINLYII